MAQVAGSLSNGMETLSHVFRLVEAFRAFDANNDGYITTAQLGGIMASLGYNPNEQDLKVMMQRGDTDRDSLLSIEEFLEMNTNELGLGSLATHLRSTVKALDLEGDSDEDVTGEEIETLPPEDVDTLAEPRCSSRRYGAPAPSRIGNGVLTRPHAPPKHRRVRSVSATRPRRSHALPHARGRTHAPTRAAEELPRAATRPGRVARARTRGEKASRAVNVLTRQGEAVTHSHAPDRRAHALARADTRGWKGRHAPRTGEEDTQVSDFDSLALLEVSQHSEFIREVGFQRFYFYLGEVRWRSIILGSMILLSATNYSIWKPRMENILFCKDLHDSLENKGEKTLATKDEEWRKMNRKTIGLIRQCIGHEVSHHIAQETSAYELWIKLEEMYQAKTSQNKALLMRRLVNLKLQRETTALLLLSSLLESWETLVVPLSNLAPNGKLTTSMVMDALFNEEARRREMGLTDQSESQALVSEESRERDRGQGRGHHRGTGKGRWRSQARDTAATAVMAVDESDVLLAASEDGKSDWILDSGSAYHLCRDREVFTTYAPCEGRIWMANKTSSRVVGKGSVRFRMADGSFDASGGTLRVSKGNKEMLWGKKTRGQLLYRGTQSKRRGTWRIYNVQDVHREAQRKETMSILRSYTAKGAAMPKRVSFALDLISGGDLSNCAHKRGEMEPRQLSYEGAGSEAVKEGQLEDIELPSSGLKGEIIRIMIRYFVRSQPPPSLGL
ncbi:hypothetical protein Acr_21g0002480 [Actinidia rufa]|uniref:EF-hand domain-containing protein n=1 Tax=Actinidia rufa TaxID=165716 RepID=A0A7J0GFR8_9ERIC|nr:hypothetical protein Acr_21g0002480 [Actinidia rufa]